MISSAAITSVEMQGKTKTVLNIKDTFYKPKIKTLKTIKTYQPFQKNFTMSNKSLMKLCWQIPMLVR